MVKKLTKTQVAKEQKLLLAVLKKMPKISSRSSQAQLDKLYDFCLNSFRNDVDPQINNLCITLKNFLYQDPNYRFMRPQSNDKTLSARGWHKDHNNYNKAESWELPPSLRRTPARNVTKTGAKRKRSTSITKYKR